MTSPLLRTDRTLSENDAHFLAEEVWPVCGSRALSESDMAMIRTHDGTCRRCGCVVDMAKCYCPVCRAIMRAETYRRYEARRAA